jgi:hypothetical protein
MVIDKQLEFCLNQAETTADSHVSDNIIDMGHAGDAVDKELWFEILCTESFNSDGAATVQFKLQTATDDDFTAPVDLIDFGAISYSTLVAGYKLRRRLPPGALQYLRVLMTIGVAVLKAGKFSAFLTPAVQTNKNTF